MNKVVTHLEFLKLLEHEYSELKAYGTPYRKETARLALEVAKRHMNPLLFLERENARMAVLQVRLNMDVERLNDVSKMLSVVANVLNGRAKQSDAFKRRVNERVKRNLQAVRLIKVK